MINWLRYDKVLAQVWHRITRVQFYFGHSIIHFLLQYYTQSTTVNKTSEVEINSMLKWK